MRAAVDAVVQRVASGPTSTCSEIEARQCLLALAAAVEVEKLDDESRRGAQRSGGPGLASPTFGAATERMRGPLARRLLELLRAELIRAWAEQQQPPEPRHMLPTLTAIERVTATLAAAADDPTQVPTGLDFIAGVGHDLRSPLTSILFLAETLHSQQSGEVNELQRRQLGIIYSAALGLVSVASDIIELARGGDGLTERRPIPLSITEILESVHDIVRPMAEEKELRVQLFPPEVDQRLGYPLALSRVLLNLTTNGLKFTDSGFVELSCRTTASDRVEFSVRDTGKGYSPDAIDSLYQAFRRSRDGKKFGFSGSGLGLAISRKLVAAMGSTLEVETRPRWGTRFHFELYLPPIR